MANLAFVTSDIAQTSALQTRDALISAGHTVTLIADSAIGSTDFSGYDAVVANRLTDANKTTIAGQLNTLVDGGKPLLIGTVDAGGVTGNNNTSTVTVMGLTGVIRQLVSFASADEIVITDNSHSITMDWPEDRLTVRSSTTGGVVGSVNNLAGATQAPPHHIGESIANGDPDVVHEGFPNLIAIERGTARYNSLGNTGARIVVYGTFWQAYNGVGARLLDNIIKWLLADPDLPERVESEPPDNPDEIKIRWGRFRDATSYSLQYSADGGATWTTISGITARFYILAGLTIGRRYRFRLIANTPSGPTAPSRVVTESPGAFSHAGTFSKRSGTGTQQVTGIGFQPKALLIWSAGTATFSNDSVNDAVHLMYGMTSGPGQSYNSGIATAIRNSGVTQSTLPRSRWNANVPVYMLHPDGTVRFSASLTSFDHDGFTLNWTANSAADTVFNYIAFGGSEVQARVQVWNHGTGAGSKTVNGVGFQPQLLFNLFVPVGGTTERNVSFGMWDGTRHAVYSAVDDMAGTNWQSQAAIGNDRIAIAKTTGNLTRIQADATAFTADGFTFNFGTVNTAYNNLNHGTLCIRGLPDRYIGTTNSGVSTETQTDVTAPGFEPATLFLMHQTFDVQTGVTQVVNNAISHHAAFRESFVPSTQYLHGSGAAGETHRWMRNIFLAASVKSQSPTNTVLANHVMLSNGFRLNWTLSSNVARGMGYLVLGSDTVIPDPVPPATPANLNATPLSHDQVSVSWDSVTDATSYDLRVSLNETDWSEMTGVTSPVIDSGLEPETTYYYQVRACNADGCSPWSSSASTMTLEAPVGDHTAVARFAFGMGFSTDTELQRLVHEVEARFGFSMGARMAPQATRIAAVRFGVGFGVDASATLSRAARVRFSMGMGLAADTSAIRVASARFGFGLGISPSAYAVRVAAARFAMAVSVSPAIRHIYHASARFDVGMGFGAEARHIYHAMVAFHAGMGFGTDTHVTRAAAMRFAAAVQLATTLSRDRTATPGQQDSFEDLIATLTLYEKIVSSMELSEELISSQLAEEKP